jgi:hypothetical protein
MVKLWDFESGTLIMNGIGHSGLVSWSMQILYLEVR